MDRYVWDVHFAADKDALKVGDITAGTHRVAVLADDLFDSRLIAESMVACHGLEPTSADLIDFP